MRTISVLTGLILFIAQSSIAQDEILKSNDEEGSHIEIGGFFSFDSKLSTIHGENVWFSGGTFGLVVNHRFRIGLGGYSLDSKSIFEYRNPEDMINPYHFNTEIGYFGLVYEHIFLPNAPVHITIPVLLAGGKVTIKQEVPLNQVTFHDKDAIENTYWATVERSNIAVIEPGINFELEIFSWLNLDLGTGYRYVLGSQLNSLPNSDRNLSQVTFHTGLKFNCF